MTENSVYSRGEFSLTEWEDVNYCEHYFSKGDVELSDTDVVDLLNKLTKENEQLKKELEQDDLKNIKEANIKLFKENEQLKQRIKELEKEVDALSDGEADWLIEEML